MSENSDEKFGLIAPEVCGEQSGLEIFRKMATAEGRLIDAGGKLYAHATTACFIFDL